MYYSIGQVSEMFGLPVSTLRYYDKEGFFPDLERVSGIRKFSQRELEILRVIECLKKSGLEIKDIRQFIQWCSEESDSYSKRRDLFEAQKKNIEDQIKRLERALDMIKFKCWYYDRAMEDGNEEQILKMLPDRLPPDIQKIYDRAHEK